MGIKSTLYSKEIVYWIYLFYYKRFIEELNKVMLVQCKEKH